MPIASYVKEGRYLNVPAASVSAAVTIGDVFIYGTILGIATVTVASGSDELVVDVGGVYDIAKNTSTAFTVGARVYWDIADEECNSDSGNQFVGIAVEAAATSATTVRVKLMALDAVDSAQVHSVSVPLGTVAAGTDTKLMAFVAPKALTIQAVKLVDVAGIAADATDYTTIALYNETGSATVADWSTVTGGDGALTALTAASIPLEAGEATLTAGDVLSVTKTDAASGKATDDAVVQIDYVLA